MPSGLIILAFPLAEIVIKAGEKKMKHDPCSRVSRFPRITVKGM